MSRVSCFGVVSERDIFSLQRVNLVHLTRAIANAPNLAALISIRKGHSGPDQQYAGTWRFRGADQQNYHPA